MGLLFIDYKKIKFIIFPKKYGTYSQTRILNRLVRGINGQFFMYIFIFQYILNKITTTSFVIEKVTWFWM